MENLSINDAGAPSSPQRGPGQPQPGNPVFAGTPPQGAPQLPPQMFTTAAQLLDLTDKKLLLVLRDGRKIHGVLRSWDQFANLVLTDTRERYFVTIPASSSDVNSTAPSTHTTQSQSPSQQARHLYCDIPRGTYLVRGENVLLLGEVDLDRDDEPPAGYVEGDVEEVFQAQKAQEQKRRARDKVRLKKLAHVLGGEVENSGEVLF